MNKTLPQLTAEGMVTGTPKYMSPELIRGEADARSDVWALAVIAYRCLSGAHPYEGPSMIELMQSILEDESAPITRHARGLPPALDALFARAFHGDRSARFQTPEAFVSALEEAVTRVPTTLPMPSSTSAPPPVALRHLRASHAQILGDAPTDPAPRHGKRASR